MMKTIGTWAKMLIFVMMGALSLTSCDKDEMKAANLDGTWEGDFFMTYENDFGLWNATSTVIEFHQKPFKNYGIGYQTDFYPIGCPVQQTFFEFDWSVDNGDITLVYPTNPALNTVIRGYRMSSSTFYGRIGDTKKQFSLRKVEDYDWGIYSDRVNQYYYSRTRSAADTDNDTKNVKRVIPNE